MWIRGEGVKKSKKFCGHHIWKLPNAATASEEEVIPQIETFIDEIELFAEAFTYFRVTPSPLIPSMIEGSATKTARGWAQTVELNPKALSVDPDSPEDKVFQKCHFEEKAAVSTLSRHFRTSTSAGFADGSTR